MAAKSSMRLRADEATVQRLIKYQHRMEKRSLNATLVRILDKMDEMGEWW